MDRALSRCRRGKRVGGAALRQFFLAMFITVYFCWSVIAVAEITAETIPPTRTPTPTIFGDVPQVPPWTPTPTPTLPLNVTVEWITPPTKTRTATPTETGTRFVLYLTPVATPTPTKTATSTVTPTPWRVWLPVVGAN